MRTVEEDLEKTTTGGVKDVRSAAAFVRSVLAPFVVVVCGGCARPRARPYCRGIDSSMARCLFMPWLCVPARERRKWKEQGRARSGCKT